VSTDRCHISESPGWSVLHSFVHSTESVESVLCGRPFPLGGWWVFSHREPMVNRTDTVSNILHLVGKDWKQIIAHEIRNYSFALSAEKYGVH